MTGVVDSIHAKTCLVPPFTSGEIRIALLGVGQVGGAVAALAADPGLRGRFTISRGLVRDLARQRPQAADIPLTCNLDDALEGNPAVAIEVLGGLEPARTLVLDALDRGIPVVTANKSLLAAHGEELLDQATRLGVPLRYEATVLAGVPFLTTFGRRSLAREVSAVCGIVNGTTNFIVSKMSNERRAFAAALADAQRCGYAEPDPANDIEGIDAVEKLCILLRHFGDWQVRTSDVDVEGITDIGYEDIQAAARLDGRIRPVVYADWSAGPLRAFCGPAFLPSTHALASVDGVQNALILRNRRLGDLLFAGAGAGPEVTAATLLDDAVEALSNGVPEGSRGTWKRGAPASPATGWFVRLTSERLPEETVIVRHLEANDVSVSRTLSAGSGGGHLRWLLTHPCERTRIDAAADALRSISNCQITMMRTLEC